MRAPVAKSRMARLSWAWVRRTTSPSLMSRVVAGDRGVGGLDEAAAAVEEDLEVVAVSLEGLAEFVDDRAQGLQGYGAGQVVHAREDVGDRCRDLGVGLFDAGAVGEEGAVVALGAEVDVLLADGGESGDHGPRVGGDLRGGPLDAQVGHDAFGGQTDVADPPHGDAPVGDVGVGEQTSGAGEMDLHGVVVGDSRRSGRGRRSGRRRSRGRGRR